MRLPLLALALALLSCAGAQNQLTGVPSVIDGDTLEIRGTRIRLHAIDAPESSQICIRNGVRYGCGREAANWLSGVIAGRPVTCVRRDTDRYNRMVATCYLGQTDLNRLLVGQGWALAYMQYGGQIYRADEERARQQRLGMHAGWFQNPWAYRQNPQNPPTAVPTVGGSVYFRNCAEARAAGAAPIRRGQPGYREALDGDRDGVACE